jgi:hypothetical protein
MNQARIKRDIIVIGASFGGVPANLTEDRAGRTLRLVHRTSGLLRCESSSYKITVLRLADECAAPE